MARVLKREGEIEEWDKTKLVNSLQNIGLAAGQAEEITLAVENWANASGHQGPIPTAEIRAKVMQALQIVNPSAASSYESWKKTPSAA